MIGDAAADGRVFVVLAGCAPVLAGWSLAAIVEHRHGPATLRPVSEAGHRLRASAYRAARCEHCGLRRRRAQTFIVVHADSGEIRQVGSGCLRDFVGGHDPDRACRQAEYLALARTALADADHAADTPRRERPSEPALQAFAAHAAGAVRRGGWTSHEQARRGGGAATADVALRAWQSGQTPSPADRALAAAALRWARTLLASKAAPTPFERAAAAVAVSTAALDHRERGLVAALIGVYRRQRARSRHLGEPGSQLERAVLVERVLARRSARHGTVRRCELLDADANRLVWWQTEGEPLREGELVTLAGRVARHSHFGATAVTVLSHCRRAGAPAGGLAAAGSEASPARRLT